MMYNNFMPSFSIKVSGQSPEWRNLGVPLTRVSGEWKPCKQVWAKVNDTWTKVFDLEIADPFDGSGSLDGSFTPGQAVWKVYSGSITRGSGLATSGSTLPAIAGIETGTDKNIQLEIDSGSSSTAGMGVSFWIQDQSNWWGAQIYYQAYSTTIPGTTVFYNLRCANYTYTVTNIPGPTNFDIYNITNYSVSPSGTSFQYRRRTCRANGTYGPSQLQYSGCAGISFGCSEVPMGVGEGEPCTSDRWARNCGGTCTTFCSAPSAVTNYAGTGPCPAPAPANNFVTGCGQGDNAVAAGPGTFPSSIFGDWTGNLTATTNFACSNPQTTPGTCTHTKGPNSAFFITNFNGSFDVRPTSPFPCPAGFGQLCESFPSSITNNPTTSFSTFRKARIIRSTSGSVSEVASTNNIPDGTTLGGLMTELTSSQIRVTAYAGAARTSPQPTLTYNIPSGTTKSTKHGILVAAMPSGTYGGAPSFQGYSISRFKATLT